MLEKQNQIKISLGILGIILATSAFLVSQNSHGLKEQETAVYNSAAAKAISMTPEERRQMFEQWRRDQLFFKTISEAASYVPFKLKEPLSRASGKRLGVFVDKDNFENRQAQFVYGDPGNGITVLARKQNEGGIDYDAAVKQMEEDKAAGIVKSDNVPNIIYVNGNKGWGVEPGYNLIQGEKLPRPGFVGWTLDGADYVISGTSGKNATTLETLIEIAESIE